MADQEARNMSMYPLDAKSYHIMQEIGSGVSGVVYKAMCVPMNSAVVAIKAIDLEKSRANLDDVRREAKVMALFSHPNILRAHCSFIVDSHLWVVMPFMAAGSLHSIISSSFPDGLPEPSIAIVLKEILSALSYLHDQGHIHRDIKAGNILVDSDGSVKLADFGVSASIYESYHWSCSASSFCNEMAGTPYWMAPEVIHSHMGYGVKADIWSFGITALELAHGRPPLSHLPLSKSLSQDPSKRPSAGKLLRHPFFKNCKSAEYLVKNVLQVVPPKDVRASPPNSAAVPKQLLIPNLVSLLSSLDVQRVMVKNVLACCGDTAVDEEKFRDQREQQLLGVVQRLQQTVDELNIQRIFQVEDEKMA